MAFSKCVNLFDGKAAKLLPEKRKSQIKNKEFQINAISTPIAKKENKHHRRVMTMQQSKVSIVSKFL